MSEPVDLIADAKEWLAEEQQGLRLGQTHSVLCHRRHPVCLVWRLLLALERTPQPHATPGECAVQGECTNHDAVPAARVRATDESSLHAASELGNPGAASRDGEVTGTTREPVAWAVVYFDEIDSVYDSKADCERFIETQCRRDYLTPVPLYRHPSPSEWEIMVKNCESACREEGYKVLAAEIGALHVENDKLKEAIRRLADQDATLSACDGNVTVVMDATLTDAEREAIQRDLAWLQWCEDNRQIGDVGRNDIAALRGLLERTAQDRQNAKDQRRPPEDSP